MDMQHRYMCIYIAHKTDLSIDKITTYVTPRVHKYNRFNKRNTHTTRATQIHTRARARANIRLRTFKCKT